MKKTISIILAIMMVATLSVSAFALDLENTPVLSKDVTVTIDQLDIVNKYAVEVEWDELAFNYNEGTKTWNTEELKWDYAGAAWAEEEKNIEVSNKSSLPVDVVVAYVKGENEVVGTVTNGEFVLDAVVAENKTVDSEVATLKLSGTAKAGTVGKVTVTLDVAAQ